MRLTCDCGRRFVRKRKRDGKKCPECIRKRMRLWRAANQEACREHARRGQKAWQQRDPEGYAAARRRASQRHRIRLKNGQGTIRQYLHALLHHTRCSNSARKRKVDMSITIDDLLSLWKKQKGICALSRLQMTFKTNNLLSVSLDRKDSAGHYTPDNIQFVCRWVNLGKGNRTDAEMRSVIKMLRK